MRPAVLHVVDSFNQGGTERQAVQLTRLLVESGRYQIHLACLNPQGPLRAEVEHLGLGEIAAYPLTSFRDLNAAVQLRTARSPYAAARCRRRAYARLLYERLRDGGRGPGRRAGQDRLTTGDRGTPDAGAALGGAPAYGVAHAVVANAEAVRTQLAREGSLAR